MRGRFHPLVSAAILSCVVFRQPVEAAPPFPVPAGKPVPLPKGAVARLGSTAFLGERPARCLAVSRDGKLLVTANDDAINVWNAETGNRIRRFVGPAGPVTRLVITPDGRTLVAASLQLNEVSFWNLGNGRLAGQTGRIRQGLTAFGLSANGRLLATGTRDGSITLWNVKTGREGPMFTNGRLQGPITGVAFAPDGRQLAAVEVQSRLLVWDTENREVVFDQGQREDPRDRPWRNSLSSSVVFTPDGKALLLAGPTGVWFLNPERWTDPARIVGLKNYRVLGTGLAISPDGGILVVRSADKNLCFLDLTGPDRLKVNPLSGADFDDLAFSPGGKKLAVLTRTHNVGFLDLVTNQFFSRGEGHTKPVRGLAFSRDGGALVTAGEDGGMLVWDVKNQEMRRRFDLDTPAYSLAFSRDGKKLAAAGQGVGVRVFGWPSGNLLVPPAGSRPLNAAAGTIEQLTFSPDGTTLASGLSDGRVYLWDAADGLQRDDLRRYETWARARLVAFLRGGESLLSAGGDRVYEDDLCTRRMVRSWEVPRMACAALSPDGKHLAVGGRDNVSLVRFDASNGLQRERLDAGQISDIVGCVAFSNDNRWLAAGDRRGLITVWDVASGKLVRSFPGHSDAVSGLAFAPDGRTLASGSDDATVLLWDVAHLAKRAAAGGK
jgi:WD40 repeat protein